MCGHHKFSRRRYTNNAGAPGLVWGQVHRLRARGLDSSPASSAYLLCYLGLRPLVPKRRAIIATAS